MSSATGLDPAIEYHVVNSLGWPGLRPLQAAAVAPVRAGDDCVLLAPTAGGKTEAATFPLLSRMTADGWSGTSVLYVTPLARIAQQPPAASAELHRVDRPHDSAMARRRRPFGAAPHPRRATRRTADDS